MLSEVAHGSRRREETRSAYPAHLIDVWRAPTGERLTVRPVLPHDAGPLGAMFDRLSRTASYNRFHGTMALPPHVLHAMTHVDYRRHLALVVTTARAGSEIIVAEARYVADETGDAAELAIVVEDGWHRTGLATRVMNVLMEAARSQGLVRLHGSVLSSNAAMLGLMKRCGFSCASDPYDRRCAIVEVRLADWEPAQASEANLLAFSAEAQ